LRFQEDTARHLFRMQIIGPDGTPIETAEQMQAAQAQRQAPPSEPPALRGPASGQASLPMEMGGESAASPVRPSVPTRAPSTTIDALEKEFQQKKKRELEQARAAGSATSSNGNAPRVTGEKVGRNDKCPCGSGKKYKHCHGAQA